MVHGKIEREKGIDLILLKNERKKIGCKAQPREDKA